MPAHQRVNKRVPKKDSVAIFTAQLNQLTTEEIDRFW